MQKRLRVLSVLLLLTNSIKASCPTPITGPKWIWSPIYYQFSTPAAATALSTATSTAASGWSGAGNINISTNVFSDITLFLSNLPTGVMGQTKRYSQGESSCYNKLDNNGRCMDRSVMYYATVEIDTAEVAAQATLHSVSYNDTLIALAGHELGHALGVDHPSYVAGVNCSSTPPSGMDSIMHDDYFYNHAACGQILPTSCDIMAVDTLYSGWDVGAFYACSGTDC